MNSLWMMVITRLLFVIFAVELCSCANLYVQQSSSYTSICDLTHPCGLIKDALDAASSGDTINISPGSYAITTSSGYSYSLASVKSSLLTIYFRKTSTWWGT